MSDILIYPYLASKFTPAARTLANTAPSFTTNTFYGTTGGGYVLASNLNITGASVRYLHLYSSSVCNCGNLQYITSCSLNGLPSNYWIPSSHINSSNEVISVGGTVYLPATSTSVNGPTLLRDFPGPITTAALTNYGLFRLQLQPGDTGNSQLDATLNWSSNNGLSSTTFPDTLWANAVSISTPNTGPYLIIGSALYQCNVQTGGDIDKALPAIGIARYPANTGTYSRNNIKYNTITGGFMPVGSNAVFNGIGSRRGRLTYNSAFIIDAVQNDRFVMQFAGNGTFGTSLSDVSLTGLNLTLFRNYYFAQNLNNVNNFPSMVTSETSGGTTWMKLIGDTFYINQPNNLHLLITNSWLENLNGNTFGDALGYRIYNVSTDENYSGNTLTSSVYGVPYANGSGGGMYNNFIARPIKFTQNENQIEMQVGPGINSTNIPPFNYSSCFLALLDLGRSA
jgi:hypothetical protein